MTRMILFTIAFVILTAASRAATTYYVDAKRPDDSGDGLSWATAKQTIQAAVDLTTDGDTVLVAKGKYKTGSRMTPQATLMNRLVITNAISVVGTDGPKKTVIVGAPDKETPRDPKNPYTRGCGPHAVRCVYISSGMLSGFTLAKGYTSQGSSSFRETCGGGVLLWNAVVSNCVIVANGAYAGGGACCIADARVCDCVVERNHAYLGGGATVYSFGCKMLNCIISRNLAMNGGGAYGIALENCTISRNAAGEMGGGVCAASVSDSSIAGNRAQDGGGIGTLPNQLATVVRSKIVGNRCVGRGGGLYGTSATNCVISGNRASGRDQSQHWGGGGTFIGAMHNCLIVGNRSDTSGGGASLGSLFNCTVCGNSAKKRGGGLFYSFTTDTIVWGNKAHDKANCSTPTNRLIYCCTTEIDNETMPGSINADPLFVNPKKGDYHLQSGSPCINTGTNLPWMTSATDLDGKPRVVNGTVDMGCYEHQ